jgi:2-amino-4-hydroxy-6-hydroxymethyldihydropteridine diphosphokinase
MPSDRERHPVRAAIALGANLGDRAGQLASALAALAATPGVRVLASSRWHETTPESGDRSEPSYLNGAALLETTLCPRELLERMLAIEAAHGRVRDPLARARSRTLDLDLLLYGDQEIDEPGLRVPHPRLEERLFVLGPLAEIAPGLVLPRSRRTVSERLAELARAREAFAR